MSRAFAGAFIMIGVASVFVHFGKETPEEKAAAEERAHANTARLVEQLEQWRYERSFNIGVNNCRPVYDDPAEVDAE